MTQTAEDRMRTLLPFLILVAACGGGSSNASPPEEAARIAFDVLKERNFDHYVPRLPNVEDVRWYLGFLKSELGEEKSAEFKRLVESRGGVPEFVARANGHILRGFERARKEAAKDFDWNDAEFAGVSGTESRERQGLTWRDIRFRVKAGGKTWSFRLNGQAKFKRGWLTSGGFRYDGEDK